MNNLEETSTLLSIPNNACNSNSLTLFDLGAFIMLQSITIGNENFMYASTFIIDNLFNLQSIVIRQNSFTHLKSDDYWDDGKANNPSRSFSILNCVELESIEIGEYSFCDYGGGFELKNLPKLSTIIIGEIESNSFNFYYSSFMIEGIIDMILLMNRSS